MSNQTRYNPFSAACAQLTTPEAQAWYLDQIEAGAARHIGAVTAVPVVAFFSVWFVSTAVYALVLHGVAAYQFSQQPAIVPDEVIQTRVDSVELNPQAVEVDPWDLPCGFEQAIALQMEPLHFYLAATHTPLMLPPAPPTQEIVEALLDAIASTDAVLASLDSQSVTQLRRLAKERGVKNVSKLSKAKLLEVLGA